MRKNIFETNQDRHFDVEVRAREPARVFAGSETSHPSQLFDKSKPAPKGDIFSEDDQAALAVAGYDFAGGAHEKAAVEKIRLLAAVWMHPHFPVIAAKHQPDLVSLDQV